MDETAARARLARMIASSEEPTLQTADIDDLITIAKRTDPAGLAPSNPSWTPTWDLNAAAAEGWLWKAGICSPNYDFGEDRQQFSRDQVFAHCMAMHEIYRQGGTASARVASMIDDFNITIP